MEQLDLAKIPVTAAFWLYADDAAEWRLVIVSPSVETLGPRHLYALLGLVNEPFGRAGFNSIGKNFRSQSA